MGETQNTGASMPTRQDKGVPPAGSGHSGWDDHVRYACGAGILGIATWGVACMALGLPLPKEHGQLVAAGVGMALYALFAMSAGEAETAETTKIVSVHEQPNRRRVPVGETQNTGAPTNPTGRDELVERVTEPRQDTVEKVARAIRDKLYEQDGMADLIDGYVPPKYAELARAAINAMSDVREALDWRQVQIETRRHAGRFVDRCDIEAVLKGIAALESLSGGGK